MVSQGGPHLHGGNMQVCLTDTMRACMSVVNTVSGAQHWISSGYSWRREWLPTPIFLTGESHGERGLMGYGHGVAKSWTRLKLSAIQNDIFPLKLTLI